MTHTLPSNLANHQRGAALEELIAWQNNIYANQGRALVWHNGTQGKVRGGNAILVKSRPDFEGVLTCMGGRHVAFDAKLTAKPTYYHPRDRRHQLVDLWDVHQAGGVAFLLVSLEMERFFLLWPQAGWEQGEFATIRLNDLRVSGTGTEIACSGSYGLPSWLDVIEQREAGRD